MDCLISTRDLRPFLPAGSVSDEQLAILVEDAQALITHYVPCLRGATPQVMAAARALIRQSLRSTLGDGATSVTFTHGPFSEKRSYEPTGSASDLVPSTLITALQTLCDPSRGSRMALIDLDYVDHYPEHEVTEPAIPDLRWW